MTADGSANGEAGAILDDVGSDLERERRERAEERKSRVSLRWARHGDEDENSVSGAEAVSLAMQLSRAAWAMTGRSLPAYDRRNIPVAFVPHHDA